MAWRFVRQPNGKLAIFSEIVDDFTVFDMTHDEAIEECLSKAMSRTDAESKVLRGEHDRFIIGPWPAEYPRDNLNRFRDAIETIREVHGDKLANRRLKRLST